MLKFSRFGIILVQKGIISKEVLEEALEIQAKEDPSARRGLAEILVSDFGADHDEVFGLLAKLYAFRTLEVKASSLDETQISAIKQILSPIPEDFRKELLSRNILPFHLTSGQNKKLIILAANPTDKTIEKFLYTLHIKSMK